jgi:hypothetical protein
MTARSWSACTRARARCVTARARPLGGRSTCDPVPRLRMQHAGAPVRAIKRYIQALPCACARLAAKRDGIALCRRWSVLLWRSQGRQALQIMQTSRCCAGTSCKPTSTSPRRAACRPRSPHALASAWAAWHATIAHACNRWRCSGAAPCLLLSPSFRTWTALTRRRSVQMIGWRGGCIRTVGLPCSVADRPLARKCSATSS